MRSVNSAQISYSRAPRGAARRLLLATLGTACAGSSQAFLSCRSAADPVVKTATVFAMQAARRRRLARPTAMARQRVRFLLSATPLGVGVTGHRAFAGECRGAIYYDVHGRATGRGCDGAGGGGWSFSSRVPSFRSSFQFPVSSFQFRTLMTGYWKLKTDSGRLGSLS
jgi:hypothetical protein